MSISDEQFATWLATRDVPRMYLVEAGYGYDPGVGGFAEHTARASLGGYISEAATLYPDILVGIPSIRFALDAITIGEIEIANDNGERDVWLDYAWDGREFVLLIGAPTWERADFRPVITGTLLGIHALSPSVLAWQVRDNREFLDKLCQPNLYSDGPLKDQPKPIALGYCFNVAPVLLPVDSAATAYSVTLTYNSGTGVATATAASALPYSVGDPINIYAATDFQYEGTFEVTALGTNSVSWQLDSAVALASETGTVIAGNLTYQFHDGEIVSLAQARIAGDPTTDFTLSLANGTISLEQTPFGDVRVDLLGAYDSPVIQYAGQFAQWLCDHAGVSLDYLDIDNLDAWDAANDDSLGLYLSQPKSLGEALQEIIAGHDGRILFSRAGKLQFWRKDSEFTGLDAVLTITVEDILPDSFYPTTFEPIFSKFSAGYRRNWAPQNPSGLSGSVDSATAQIYSNEYRRLATTISGTIIAQHPLVRDDYRFETLFSHTTLSNTELAISSELSRRVDLYGVPRRTYTLQMISPPTRVNLGDVVEVMHPRFGFENGLKAYVIGIEERPGDEIISMELWR